MSTSRKSPSALYTLGTRAFVQGEALRALEYFQALRDHPEASEVDQLDALAGLARAHYQLDHAQEALKHAHALEREGRRIGHIDAVADAQVFLGQIHLEYGDDKRAERSLRAVVGPESRGISTIFRANAWFLLGKIAFERGESAESRHALDRAARIFRRLDRAHGLADVEIVRGHLAHVTGQLSQALAHAREARRLFDRIGDPYGKAGAWHLEGSALQTLRRPDAAARVLTAAAAAYRKLHDPTNLASMLIELGDVFVSVGRYDAATRELEEAVGILRTLAKPHRLGPVLLALAHARQSAGEFVEALALQREATEILVAAAADPIDIACSYRAQAEALVLLGRKAEARAFFGEALQYLSAFPTELETANVHLDLARLDAGDGASLDALDTHLTTARKIFKRRQIWHSVTQIDLIEARAAAVHGDIARAFRAAGSGLRRALHTKDPHGVASARSLRAALFARLGRVHVATAEARRARIVLGRMDATWNLASLEVDLASQFHAAEKTEAAWSAAVRGLSSIERIRLGASGAPSVHADLLEAFRTAQRTALSVIRERRDVPALVERVEATRNVTAAMMRTKEPKNGRRSHSSTVRLVPPSRVKSAEVEELLKGAIRRTEGGTVTLAWYPEIQPGERDVLVVAPAHGVWLCTLAEPAGLLEKILGEILSEPGALSEDAWRARLDALAELLVENPFVRAVPLSQTRGPSPRSIADVLQGHPGAPVDLVPHGWTGLVPWSALPLRRTGGAPPEQLVERHLVRLRSRLGGGSSRDQGVRRPRRALVFAGDDASLPAARTEADTVAKLLREAGVEVVEYGPGRPLTAAKLREEAARSDLLHLATHAEFNAASSWRSFVRLSDQEPGAPGSELSLEALLDFEAAPREVVLSACSTVAVDQARLFDTFSLAHGFLHAGSSVVVGTLWRVDDAATAALMRRVYEHRLDAHHPVGLDEAVAAAVREAPVRQRRDTEAEATGATRGMLSSAVRRVVRPGASPASWAALQVLMGFET